MNEEINEGFANWLYRVRDRAEDAARPLLSRVRYSEPRSILRQIEKAGGYQKFAALARADVAKRFEGPASSSAKLGHRKGLIQNAEQALEVTRAYLRDPKERIAPKDRALLQRWTSDAPGLIADMKKSVGGQGGQGGGEEDFGFEDDFGTDELDELDF